MNSQNSHHHHHVTQLMRQQLTVSHSFIQKKVNLREKKQHMSVTTSKKKLYKAKLSYTEQAENGVQSLSYSVQVQHGKLLNDDRRIKGCC